MKEKRHAKILEIIRRQDVGTQEELCAILNREGFSTTQATVSRDIKELKLTKLSAQDGGKRYALLSEGGEEMSEKYNRVFRDGAVSIDMAQNLLVIRTNSGMAMAVAMAIDTMDRPGIVGTIAGDDTVLCVVRTEEDAGALMRQFRKLLA